MNDNTKPEELAFPVVGNIVGKQNALGQPQMLGVYQSGMTLRDYFAAQCVGSSMLRHLIPEDPATDFQIQWGAKECYRIADAMIAERSKHGR